MASRSPQPPSRSPGPEPVPAPADSEMLGASRHPRSPGTHIHDHSAPRVRSHMLSTTASQKSHLADMTARYNNLHKAFEKAQARLEEMTGELRKLRATADTQGRELSHLRVSSRKMLESKRAAEAEAKAKGDYAKRIEQKLAVGAKGQYLAQQNHSLRDKVKTLRGQLETATGSLEQREAELSKATMEIEVLARALELRAEELALDGNLRSGLLYEVAQRKEEARRLAIDLSAKNRRVGELETALAETQDTLESTTARGEALAGETAEQQGEISALHDQVKSLQEAAAKTEEERAFMLDYVQEQAEQIAGLKAAVASAKADLDRANQAAAMDVDEARSRVAALEGEKEALEAKLRKLHQVQAATEQALGREREQGRDASAKGAAASARVDDLASEVTRLRSEVSAGAEARDSLQARLRAATNSAAEARARADETAAQVSVLRRERDTARDECETIESTLRKELERTLGQLQQAVEERTEAQSSAEHAGRREAALMISKQELEDSVRELGAQVDGLGHGKALMQRTMLSQLGNLREQVQQLQGERAMLSAKLAAANREIDRLRAAAGLPPLPVAESGDAGDGGDDARSYGAGGSGVVVAHGTRRSPLRGAGGGGGRGGGSRSSPSSPRTPSSSRHGLGSSGVGAASNGFDGSASASLRASLSAMPPEASPKEKAAALVRESLARANLARSRREGSASKRSAGAGT